MSNTSLVVSLVADDKLTPQLNRTQKEIEELGVSAKRLQDIPENFKKIKDSSTALPVKIRQLKSDMRALSLAGAENSELFKQMAGTLYRWTKAQSDAEKAIKRVTAAAKGESAAVGDVSAQLKKGLGPGLNNILSATANTTGLGGLVGQLSSIGTMAGAATMGVGALSAVLFKSAQAAAEFETHLDALQSLTGLADDGMAAIADGALEMSKAFGVSASGVVDAMGIIGSQAPELLSDADALMAVTEAANVLSKAAGIEVVASAKGITTVMNQMGVSADRCSDIINTLAAGSQKGSADVAYLQTAIEKSGTIASQSGVGFEDLAGAIETIAPKFSSAEVAGTSLAAFFKSLEKQSDSKLKPSVVGISAALENLAAANMSTAEQMKMFGDAGYAAAVTLINQRDQFRGLTEAMTGTNTAYEQMATVTDNFEGKMARLKSQWEAMLIVIGDSKWLSSVTDSIQALMSMLGEIMDSVEAVVVAFDSFDSGAEGVNLFVAQLEALKWILQEVLAAIEIVVRFWAKAFNALAAVAKDVCEVIARGWDAVTRKFEDIKAFKSVKIGIEAIHTTFKWVVKKVKAVWSDFLRWLGMEAPEIAPEPGNVPEPPEKGKPQGGGGNGGGNGDGNGGKLVKTTKAEAGSIADLQSKIRALDDELNNSAHLSAARIAQIRDERREIERQIQALKDLQRESGAPMERVEATKPQALTGSPVPALDTDAGKSMVNDGLQSRLDAQYEAFKAHRERIKGIIDSMRGDTDEGAKAFTDLALVLGDSMSSASDKAAVALGTVGTALQQIGGDGIVAKTGAVMAAIGQAILGFATASAQASSLGPFGWLAFVGAGLGTLTSMISALQSFNSGGIVEGNSFTGDRMLARVNAGEMILTRPQQSRLFSMLDGDAMGGGVGTVVFDIAGDRLVGVINNYNRKMGKAK